MSSRSVTASADRRHFPFRANYGPQAHPSTAVELYVTTKLLDVTARRLVLGAIVRETTGCASPLFRDVAIILLATFGLPGGSLWTLQAPGLLITWPVTVGGAGDSYINNSQIAAL